MQTPIRNIPSIIIMVLSLQAFVACNDDAIGFGGYDEGKTSIELSVGGVGEVNASRMRAITKDPNEVAKRGIIPAGTALYMVMKSENAVSLPTETKYAVTRGVTKDADAERKSPIDFSQTGCTRYWDDCFARNAHLTIYAACAPGSTKAIEIGGKTESDYPWTTLPTTGAWSNTTISPTIANWTVSENQTTETLRDDDLCYSNNISEYTLESTDYDERLKFDSGTRKFDQGNLCFYHALSWITFEIIRDEESFTEAEFQFATGTNIKLTNFFTKNTEFDIPTGEFTGAYSSQPIRTMAQRATATTGSAFTLDALVMPTTDMSSTTKGDIHLIIANNEYNLSKKELLDKIQESDKTNHLIEEKKLKPGVHYVFKLRIGKTKIKDITATILEWETVTADTHTPSNAKVTLKLEARTGPEENAYIYRAAETTTKITGDILSEGKGYVWDTGYGNADRNAYTAYTHALSKSWYWPDNKTFYHFRAIAPQAAPAPTTVDGKDCVALTSGDPPYTDVCWGAPFPKMEPSTKFVYSLTNGFAGTDGHQIHYAIGATESPLKLLLFHVMSDVTINISSVGGEAKVDLGDGTSTTTQIELKNIYTEGRVQLGNGLVLGTDTQTGTHTFPLQGGTTLTWSNYGAIPQSLAGVVLEITTPDHNHYLIDLANVKASASNISSKNVQNPYAIVDGKCTINRWYPDYKYTYSFTLSKKGVTGITCTILDWEKVEADDEEIQIK